MKLNETSMSKLFDLMLMCFKAQVVLTSSPAEIFSLTVNHIKELIKLLGTGPAVTNVRNALTIFRNKY